MALKTNHSFKVDILLIFIPLFIITFLGIRFYSHYEYTQDVLSITHTFPSLTNDSAMSDVNDYLKPAGVTKITAELLQNQKLDLSAPDLQSDLHTMLDTYPQLTSIYITDSNGNFTKQVRINDPSQDLSYMPNLPSNATFAVETINVKKSSTLWAYFDNNGQLINNDKSEPQSDARSLPSYQGAISNQGYWMNMFDAQNNNVGISVSYPIINSDGKILGVVGVDFNATAISNYLLQLQQSLNSTLFIVNDQGMIIKANPNDPSNNLIDGALTEETLTSKYPTTFKINNVSYIIDMTSYPTDYGTQWRFGTIIPLQAVLGKINQTDQIILYFTIAMLCITILFALLIAGRLSSPLKRLARETLKFKQLEFNQIKWPRSSISEVNNLTQALKSSQKTLITATRYLPKTLVKQLLRTESLEAEQHTLALLSSNINNFHALLETNDPEALTTQLSQYLEQLTQSALLTSGLVDHYVNNSFIAFWGAPIKDEQQAQHAAISALHARQSIQNLNHIWQENGQPTYQTYFGLHLGKVITGHIGSSDCMNYTMIGESVNFVKYLPQINATYGTKIIASHSFYKTLQNEFLFRPVDFIKIPGRQNAIPVYELVAALNTGAPEELQANPQQMRLCELTRQAFSAYDQQDFKLALHLYTEIHEQYPHDTIASIFMERCQNQDQ
jgi:adenylate cyclase